MTALSWSALVIGATLTLLLFAFVVRRLIGVRVPVPRTLAAGVVAVLVFSPIVTAMIGGPGFPRKGSVLPALWFVILGVVIALLAGMVFLVIAEALVPSGSVPGPVYVLRAARGRMGRAGRYWQISRILARRGLLPCCPPAGIFSRRSSPAS
jgi:ubiquinone biosynthesis protein